MAIDTDIAYKWSNVESYEVHDSRREWTDEKGKFRASVLLMCPWRKRWELFIDLHCSVYGVQGLPDPDVMKHWTYATEFNKDVQAPTIDPNSAGAIKRSIYWPRAYPDFYNDDRDPGDYSILQPTYQPVGVTTVQFESAPEKYDTDANEQVMGTKHAFLRVEYADRYNIMEEIEFKTQYINTEKKFLQWASTQTGAPGQAGAAIDIDSSPGFLETPSSILSNQTFIRHIKGVSPKELPTLLICVGRTNATAYASAQFNRTFPPQSLLMQDPIITPGMNWEGIEAVSQVVNYPSEIMGNGFNVTLRFAFKEVEGIQQSELDTFGPHNYFWRPNRRRYVSSGTAGGAPVSSDDYGSWDRFRMALNSGSSSAFPFYRPFLPLATVDRWLYSRPQLAPSLVAST